MGSIQAVVDTWHTFLSGEAPDALDDLLDDDVVFFSPIVFTPQRGKALTTLYLQAAKQTFPGDTPAAGDAGAAPTNETRTGSFRYTKKVLADDTAVLEFETTVDGKYVNGVDIIRCNDAGRIIEFRVMLRPLQAVNLMHQKMGAMLEAMQG